MSIRSGLEVEIRRALERNAYALASGLDANRVRPTCLDTVARDIAEHLEPFVRGVASVADVRPVGEVSGDVAVAMLSGALAAEGVTIPGWTLHLDKSGWHLVSRP